MPGIAEVAQALEAAPFPLTGGDVELPSQLHKALQIVFSSIKTLAEDEPTGRRTVAPLDRSAVKTMLEALLEAIDQDDPDQIEPLLETLKPHLEHSDWGQLMDQVDSFEFREAEATTKELLKQY